MKDKILIISICLVILVLTVIFGWKAMPTEMGIIVVAGAIFLSFLNIDKIQRFKGAGFEAEMRQVVEDANASIHQLRDVATTSTKATLTTLIASSFGFTNGMNLKSRLDLHDKLIADLKKLGVSEQQIEQADEMWKRGVHMIFHRGIVAAIERREKSCIANKNLEPKIREASREFQTKFLDFDNWVTGSSGEMKQFIIDKQIMNPEVEELLKDYSEFEKNGVYRRKGIFIQL
ncbi:hypothetical protein [Celerinatantimonas sp. MCCC 1A17872]|uniref:hypothetical protein n=1 Tax=Celerinatantimonas sp. MCCC 1A17872 TaxID=3177514 RepID=UPI0038C3A756